MPRIDAATVAEHRAQQRDALLDAAEELLLADGYEALDFRALGARTGLARNSVYRYFRSRDELVAELCERGMPAWLAEIDRALATERTAAGMAAAYVRVQLEMVAAGRHRLAQALAHAPLPAETVAAIHALPARAAARLEEALGAVGHPRPRVAAQLATGLLNGAIVLLHDDEPPPTITAITTAAARRAVAEAAKEA
ncbi:helix-turn-helix domain-containing protein [Conexibacter stalactiti]|uniref:Helix-turn-helix domain-containing protein n=1 Tax=Conexibacter stalactiti TaxID=1940611 RepID=A0ABU4I1B3_9ACTN|nr:helix-turn-helix domain-containing protein [Conexibacter stalactiti]MDW5598520.1 helix-turn-helix domain-containing protein [Conexibacter stalactiti]MEC5039162.1 helix-turn-helix domain-containing protein [Conexibacter stalactiti]